MASMASTVLYSQAVLGLGLGTRESGTQNKQLYLAEGERVARLSFTAMAGAAEVAVAVVVPSWPCAGGPGPSRGSCTCRALQSDAERFQLYLPALSFPSPSPPAPPPPRPTLPCLLPCLTADLKTSTTHSTFSMCRPRQNAFGRWPPDYQTTLLSPWLTNAQLLVAAMARRDRDATRCPTDRVTAVFLF
jgi:hypothetical protein